MHKHLDSQLVQERHPWFTAFFYDSLIFSYGISVYAGRKFPGGFLKPLLSRLRWDAVRCSWPSRHGLYTTPSCKSGSDFRLVLGMPLCQGGCMGPIWPETEVGQIISAHPPEIGAPVTPGVSHGTKIFGSKIFSYHPQMMLFYGFCVRCPKNRVFGAPGFRFQTGARTG